jgi:hypothetical protein
MKWKDLTVVTAFAEPASGPGWANCPIWVILRDRQGDLHMKCIQPEEQSPEMVVLYSISATVSGQLRNLVEMWRRQ